MPFAPSSLRTLAQLAAWVANHKLQAPMIIGVSGAQGAGKSTLTALLATMLTEDFGLRVASLSLDDLYLTRAERYHLSRTVHPLLATRGVPGTHDVALGIRLLKALKTAKEGNEIPLPAFDKATDDRRPRQMWPTWRGAVDIVLFEGWCVGARPQPEAALHEPISDFERYEDPDGCWRRYVNAQLEKTYPPLFALLDRLVMLKVPNMACVFRWRLEQERELARQGHALRIMDEVALERFIQHYRRLTLWMLEEMPHRADVVLTLGEDHQIHAIGYR